MEVIDDMKIVRRLMIPSLDEQDTMKLEEGFRVPG